MRRKENLVNVQKKRTRYEFDRNRLAKQLGFTRAQLDKYDVMVSTFSRHEKFMKLRERGL